MANHNRLVCAVALLVHIRFASFVVCFSGSVNRLCILRRSSIDQSKAPTYAPSRLDASQWRRFAEPSRDKTDVWLDKAAQLRKEVQELEAAVTSRRLPDAAPTKPIEYTDMADSSWTIVYRFADEPESNADASDAKKDTPERRRRFFTGKLTVRFRNDGYTDTVSFESTGPLSESNDAIKTWGWDIELSKDKEPNDVEAEYLLFSVDFKLASAPGKDAIKERLYFQARIERNPTSHSISLAEGTVTVKKDVVRNTARWGLFSPAGILAQFRYVGDFVAKPAASDDM